MRILGIDPGYATIGFGAIDVAQGEYRLFQFGTINTPPPLPFEKRLQMIYNDMNDLLDAMRPNAIAIEELFFGKNATTGIGVAHGRGVILLAAAEHEIPIFEYKPMQVKQAVCGYGKATKHQMQDMTRRLLKMQAIAKPDDAADAIAMALCHARSATSLLQKLNRE